MEYNILSINYEKKDIIFKYYNDILNFDKNLIKTSNDECTPIECIKTMIDKIPEEVFKNPNFKWLDPCCGNGNFFIVIFYKLLNYHSKKHILENMFYFNDTNSDRINIVKKIFSNNDYALNITNYNYLEFSNDNKFNVIVANPPYAKILENGSRASKNHNLIGGFIKKSFQILQENGFLLYITPDNWMSKADRNTLIKEITQKQIVYLNIHTAKKYFKKIGSSFTWYLIENKNYYKDIEIEGIYKNIEYKDLVKSQIRSFIPLYYNKIIQNILSKTIEDKNLEKFKVETSSDLHKYTKKQNIKNIKDEIFKYKLYHTPTQIVWSNKPHKYQDGFKVFIGTTSYYNVFIDNCGMTQSIAFIRCKDENEAKKYMDVLKHPLYIFINNICRWGNFNNIRILQLLPICEKKDDVYKKFNINIDEINFIESKI